MTMEFLSNKLKMPKELRQMSIAAFKQDPKLTIAIDKLYKNEQKIDAEKTGVGLVLPERKLNFHEVQQLMSQSKSNIIDKTTETQLNEIYEIRKSLVHRIENLLDNINRSAENGETPKLVIRNQRLWSNCIYDLDKVTLKSFNDAKKTTICYSNNEDKTRFNTLVFVLTKVHELMSKNLTVTRRELFYQNVSRLRNQANLDVAVRDVCCLLETPPWNLGLVATAKGLIAGPLTIHTKEGAVIDCMTSGGTLIPQDIIGIKQFKSSAKYILLVEKDAIFQKLLDEGALVRLGPVIIMTGKGYPDVCTRQLLLRLCTELRLRALALVDADPHGLEIFLTYKYGSLAQSHLSSSLACTSLVLLGARHRDVTTLAAVEARLVLTDLDKRKLNSLMKRPYLDNAVGSPIKQELQAILSSGMKAELEALAPTSAALCDAYLPSKIIQAMDEDAENFVDNKLINRAKSCSEASPSHKLSEAQKRKPKDHQSGLDITGRLKKSRLLEDSSPRPVKRGSAMTDMFMETKSAMSMFTDVEDPSALSMNFSHYELMRDLSRSNCNSDGAFSGTAGRPLRSTDAMVKDEHLEKYFRSVEMWRNYKKKGGACSSYHETP